ncbi:MAG: preprotein translocase subunit SecA [Ruminococcaceae bacterium]|nr:preprotein translocase subunit SecA [Oscillospiraceae bacterium]
MGIFSSLFASYSEKQIKKIESTVDRIEALAQKYESMSDDELKAMTGVFKGRLESGDTLDDILPDAFAVVREADWRVLGKRPFRVQLMGGILLHQGRIAEMKTGEGKTLVATLPAYLNALTGKGVHIVTVNDYLARRDSEEMGRVYGFLGLTTGLIVHGQNSNEKREAYAADITYGTNNELGFDYLRDNMVVYKERLVQRGHAFAIVDEVDSILIDEARTPLIISGEGEKSTELYDMADKLVRTMSRHVIKELDAKLDTDEYEEDFIVDEKAKTAVLTRHGIEKAERFFKIENLSDPENNNIYHHVNVAIKAHGVMKIDDDYIVKDDSVIIVDSFTGRLMPGRRYNDGLHQAIEAKEHVKIQKESKTIATITFQNYFRMYSKLSGMTGTALTEENEFREIYRLDVVAVPTNMPMIRKDHNDAIYRTRRGKLAAIIEQIKACHEKGQPVLVGTVSIDKSEELSQLLKRTGIPHRVLNAKQHDREAEIVAQAGTYGTVTISTNMAGRGTDIMLGGNPEYLAKTKMKKEGFEDWVINAATGSSHTEDEAILEARDVFNRYYEEYKEEIRPMADKVREAGGLFIIGTERHESRRIDNQLRGRSGRQGDPGESRFYLSLEDDLMRLFGSDKIAGMAASLGIEENMPIDLKMVSGAIERAQAKIESMNFQRRKNVLTYDDVMNQQRNVIYQQRAEVLWQDDMHERIEAMISDVISSNFDFYFGAENPSEYKPEEFSQHFRGLLTDGKTLSLTDEERAELDREALKESFITKAFDIYHGKDELFRSVPGAPENAMREVEKVILLRNVDSKWMDHLEAMDELKGYVGLNSYAQRDPVAIYRLESADMFDKMSEDIKEDTVRQILAVVPRIQSTERVQVARETGVGENGGKTATRPVTAKRVLGRNDPCHCGSGKKYKNCCWAKDNSKS